MSCRIGYLTRLRHLQRLPYSRSGRRSTRSQRALVQALRVQRSVQRRTPMLQRIVQRRTPMLQRIVQRSVQRSPRFVASARGTVVGRAAAAAAALAADGRQGLQAARASATSAAKARAYCMCCKCCMCCVLVPASDALVRRQRGVAHCKPSHSPESAEPAMRGCGARRAATGRRHSPPRSAAATHMCPRP